MAEMPGPGGDHEEGLSWQDATNSNISTTDCGNTLKTGGVAANEADCNTPCSGNNQQACGGPNRLTLYSTTGGPAAPSVNPGVNGYGSVGCYS